MNTSHGRPRAAALAWAIVPAPLAPPAMTRAMPRAVQCVERRPQAILVRIVAAAADEHDSGGTHIDEIWRHRPTMPHQMFEEVEWLLVVAHQRSTVRSKRPSLRPANAPMSPLSSASSHQSPKDASLNQASLHKTSAGASATAMTGTAGTAAAAATAAAPVKTSLRVSSQFIWPVDNIKL